MGDGGQRVRPARWRPPRLRTEVPQGERHATWLELFFDLVFVIAVAELAHLLHDDLSPRGLLVYAALFVPVWWQWIDFSYYGDQYDTDDLSYRLALLAAMLGVVILALTIPEVPHGGSTAFAAAYVALRVLIIALYLRARRHVPEARELAGRYAASFSIALLVWLVSFLVPEPGRFLLWGVALLIEIGNGSVTYATIRSVPAQVSHMDERFGLFVIIVLGEAVLAVATGIDGTDWETAAVVTGLAGFVAAAAMWWLYFGRADPAVITRALRGGRGALLRSFAYGYSHLFVFAGITAAGVGIEAAIEEAGHGGLTAGAVVAIGGGTAAFLAGLTILQWAGPGSLPGRFVVGRLLGAGAILLVLAVGFGPAASVVALAAILVGLAAVETARSLAAPPPSEAVAEAPVG